MWEDEIVSGEVWWLEEQNLRFGDPKHNGYSFRENKRRPRASRVLRRRGDRVSKVLMRAWRAWSHSRQDGLAMPQLRRQQP